jgi:hypothetical protein
LDHYFQTVLLKEKDVFLSLLCPLCTNFSNRNLYTDFAVRSSPNLPEEFPWDLLIIIWSKVCWANLICIKSLLYNFYFTQSSDRTRNLLYEKLTDDRDSI